MVEPGVITNEINLEISEKWGGKRVKDLTGYNLKQLLVGSEGTLGIITKTIVKLFPLPLPRTDLLVLFRDVKSAIDMAPRIMTEARVIPTSLEPMRRTKKVFDPNNIMNHGKIFDLE